jgi:uncharacterized protein (UPF0333 family)
MKILEKLTSKKGQVSMEIGILVAAAVAVAAIAAYFYVKNVKDSSNNAAESAKQVTGSINETANKWAGSIDKL